MTMFLIAEEAIYSSNENDCGRVRNCILVQSRQIVGLHVCNARDRRNSYKKGACASASQVKHGLLENKHFRSLFMYYPRPHLPWMDFRELILD